MKDLHSTNGTVINGRPIETVELHDGDMLVIGVLQIKAQFGSGQGGGKNIFCFFPPACLR